MRIHVEPRFGRFSEVITWCALNLGGRMATGPSLEDGDWWTGLQRRPGAHPASQDPGSFCLEITTKHASDHALATLRWM